MPRPLEQELRLGNRFSVDGKVAVVTGASSGLGRRFARVLAGEGALVVLAARRQDRIIALAKELGEQRALAVQTDVTDPEAVKDLVDTALTHFGALDVMVNNAGITRVGSAEEESVQSFADVMAVNLTAVFAGCREAARVMLPNRRGSIINVASMFGLSSSWPIPNASYCASKAGVVNLTRDLGAQWASRGVRVNAIAPGWFSSEMSEATVQNAEGQRYIERTVPARRAGLEHELDGVLLFLASEASSYVIGQTIAVDGGRSAA